MLRFQLSAFLLLSASAADTDNLFGTSDSNLRGSLLQNEKVTFPLVNDPIPHTSQVGVITMDPDAAKALKKALEEQSDLANYLGQWYNDELVGTQHSRYLVLLQDPLEHIAASWNRHHFAFFRNGGRPDDEDDQTSFYKCFRDMEDFCYVGLQPTTVPNDCQVLAQKVVSKKTGPENFFGEFHYTHVHHLQHVIESLKQVYVVRQEEEHMLQDLDRVHAMITTGQPHPTRHLKVANMKPSNPISMSLEATRNLCRVMCPDIQVYKQVIVQSMNLGEYAYAEAQARLATTCPHEAIYDECLKEQTRPKVQVSPQEQASSLKQTGPEEQAIPLEQVGPNKQVSPLEQTGPKQQTSLEDTADAEYYEESDGFLIRREDGSVAMVEGFVEPGKGRFHNYLEILEEDA